MKAFYEVVVLLKGGKFIWVYLKKPGNYLSLLANKVFVSSLDLSEIFFEYIIPAKWLFRLLSSRYCSFHFFQIEELTVFSC